MVTHPFVHFALFAIVAVQIAAPAASAAVHSEALAYKQDTTALEGVLIYDAAIHGKRPGVVLVPDWMGVSDLAREYAAKVARWGYVVFVADIYGKSVRPKDPKEAGAQASLYKGNVALAQARAQAALQTLLASSKVDKERTAVMGYCFGGMVALELARSGADLDGIVSIHGNLNTPHPEQAKAIKGLVLVQHGADDPYVPAEQVKSFTEEMRQGGVDWRMTWYGGAVHSFTNPNAGSDPSKGAAYNPRADARSVKELKAFFEEIFPAKGKAAKPGKKRLEG